MTHTLPGRRTGGVMEPCGALWPNGEFSIGYAPCGGLEPELSPEQYAEKWDNPIGLALDANSHKDVDTGLPPRGTGGLTSYGRRLVRNSVERLEKVYGHQNLSFVTLTLPDLTFEEFWNVSSNWAEVVRVFYQSLGRKLGRKGLPCHYAGVTEIQPERYEREGIPALHLHFVCVGRSRKKKDWAMHPVEFRRLWARSVKRFLWNEYDWSASENVQAVRYSAAGYLSKYMSKSFGDLGNIRRDGTGWSLPTAWFNISLTLRRKVAGEVRTDPKLMELLEVAARGGYLEVGCEYFYGGSVEGMTGPGPHYFVGKLKPAAMQGFIGLWRAIKEGDRLNSPPRHMLRML